MGKFDGYLICSDLDGTFSAGADIGAAVGNSVDELKNIADMVIKPASECAIRDLIERIEDKI